MVWNKGYTTFYSDVWPCQPTHLEPIDDLYSQHRSHTWVLCSAHGKSWQETVILMKVSESGHTVKDFTSTRWSRFRYQLLRIYWDTPWTPWGWMGQCRYAPRRHQTFRSNGNLQNFFVSYYGICHLCRTLSIHPGPTMIHDEWLICKMHLSFFILDPHELMSPCSHIYRIYII